MAKWDDTTLSTATTIAQWETEINDYAESGSDWSDKITLAKKIIKRDIEEKLRSAGYTCDYENDEEIINIINNADVFDLASDCKTLELIYKDLSRGDTESDFGQKMMDYRDKYSVMFDKAMKNLNLDTDQDDETDAYASTVLSIGRQSR